MATLCGICSQQPPKYKCPTCRLPYCSLACFKSHKPLHDASRAALPPAETSISAPTQNTPAQNPRPPPADFSALLTNPSIQALLTTHPTLRDDLRKIYAATLAPDPSQSEHNNHFRGRGCGFRNRGSGRGWFRGGGRGRDVPEWTPERGERDALWMLRRAREGRWDGDAEGVREFVRIIGEAFGGAGEGQEREGEGG
ncbi:hypothetical protein K432DRAFT_421536 [Lepidopterella palustris CBS 459.81]|uniref:HIT-type domain-containing protein n=1 Tax=Lepidopterella palustris CBS 459.81 TaxID=1314670 RepID=A0A8E2JKG4_9PEZI|nr:hypothetical protein K432DRAFT_421536 [Lepidopterella palustris CBS 459.81]